MGNDMETIYIAGHRNPDMDCTCAAHCYAAFKRRMNPGARYQPIRNGPLSAHIREVFELAEQPVPPHFDTIAPWVGLVARPSEVTLHPDDPMLIVFKAIDALTVSALPVIETDGTLVGVVGVNEIVSFSLAQNQGSRPEYDFRVQLFERVVPGRLLRAGTAESFRAPIMTGAMPESTAITHLGRAAHPPLLVIGNRPEIIKFAVDHQFPAIVITGVEDPAELQVDFGAYDGALFLSTTDTVETIRLLRLCSPISMVMDREVPRIAHHTSFEAAKQELINSRLRGLPVFEQDRFVGMVSRRSFIERPKPRLIMVDHNELSQSIPGAEQAEILEIVDHHRLAPPSTTQPIAVTTRPVGSTCTLIYEQFADHGLALERGIAILLLSGIISDTVNLHSPTTTEADRRAIHRLETITGISASEHAAYIFAQIEAISSIDPRDIVLTDFKEYRRGRFVIGIGQVEVTTLTDIGNYRSRLQSALHEIALEKGMQWAMLLVTDVMKHNSILLTNGYAPAEARLTFERLDQNVFDLPGVLSRKKQVVPEVLRAIDEL